MYRSLFVLCLLVFAAAGAPASAVSVGSAQQLRAAINNGETLIELTADIEFDEAFQPFAERAAALPPLTISGVTLRGLGGPRTISASQSGFRFLNQDGDLRLQLENIDLRGFSVDGNGGAIVMRGGYLHLYNVRFIDNEASGDGGAVWLASTRLYSDTVTFTGNRSVGDGGAAWVNGEETFRIESVRADGNYAGGRGGALFLAQPWQMFPHDSFLSDSLIYDNGSAGAGCELYIRGGNLDAPALFRNVVRNNCDQALIAIELQAGAEPQRVVGNTLLNAEGVVLSASLNAPSADDLMVLTGNRIGSAADICDLPTPAVSGGLNLLTDGACVQAGDGDIINDMAWHSPGTLPGSAVVVTPMPIYGLDAVPVPPAYGELGVIDGRERVCRYRDASGLGRPQDSNGDGVFACDAGALEAQNGPDLTAAQTGAYFNPERPGEGFFVEMLDEQRAVVSWFTYGFEGGSPGIPPHPRWYAGLGEVVGNSIVVDRLQNGYPSNDAFFYGSLQDDAPSLSLVFSSCESLSTPGNAMFETRYLLPFDDVPIREDLSTSLSRLTTVVPCGEQAPAAKSGLSGNFYDPARDGEGIFVEWTADGEAIVVWYAKDPDGRAIWMTSETVEVDGNRLIAQMQYPAQSTGFGTRFDPDDIVLEPWGTVTLDYTSCDSIDFQFDSELEEYGSGSYDYVRLTQPAGTSCEALPE